MPSDAAAGKGLSHGASLMTRPTSEGGRCSRSTHTVTAEAPATSEELRFGRQQHGQTAQHRGLKTMPSFAPDNRVSGYCHLPAPPSPMKEQAEKYEEATSSETKVANRISDWTASPGYHQGLPTAEDRKLRHVYSPDFNLSSPRQP